MDSYKVELTPDSGILYYRNPRTITSSAGTTLTKIRVPPSRWATFRQRLDAAKVWSWRSEYTDRGVSDGTVWHLGVAYSARRIDSGGRNAFPPKIQFERFRTAVQELIGGQPFE